MAKIQVPNLRKSIVTYTELKSRLCTECVYREPKLAEVVLGHQYGNFNFHPII